MDNDSAYDSSRYVTLALDPVHVGTGGHRLGRVDMSIVREPGTNLPKIPGTSLAGTARTYAAMQEDGKFPDCAGQGQGQSGHCGQSDCPICVTFGFSRGDQGGFQGLAQFFDARLVLFPVHSLAGPVWVTCPDALGDFDVYEGEPSDGKVRVAQGVVVNDKLNLGWLMLEKESNSFALNEEKLSTVPEEIRKRAVLVSNKLFGHIVNDNLEVRTSVSIDPKTGAASKGALFTYEALPRASVLALEVVISDPGYYRIGRKVPLQDSGGKDKVKSTVKAALNFFEYLGVGGMNTRGMGRMRVFSLDGSSSPQNDIQGTQETAQ